MTLSPLRFYTKKGPLWGSPSKTLLRTLRLSKVKLDCQSRERLGNPMEGVGVRRKEMVGGGDSRNTIRANCGTLLFSSTPSIPHPLPHPLPHPFPHPLPLQKNLPAVQAVRLLPPVLPWKLVLSPGEKGLIFRSTSYAKTQPCRLFKVPRSYGCTISHQSYNMNTVSITYPYKSVGNVLIMWVTINSTIRSKKN